MRKILLIAGCSHAAGSEIDGTEDSKTNRNSSFGGVLAKKLGREPINIACHGSTNTTISRSILDWFRSQYRSDLIDVFVLVAWTESSRMEIPVDKQHLTVFDTMYPHADWASDSSRYYIRINQGWKGGAEWEKQLIPQYQNFIAENQRYLEIYSANLVLQMQYFLQNQQVPYLMCNTMHMFSEDENLNFYLDLIDRDNYLDLNSKEGFYWKYRNLGYENKKAKYWHHDDVPHRLYAEELFQQNLKARTKKG